MTSLRVNKGFISSTVMLPGSKSYANRVLILAALNPRPFKIRSLPQSSDVLHLVSALKRCGLKIHEEDEGVLIQNSFPECEQKGMDIDVGEGGTTARFLASMLLLGKQPYKLILGKRLKDRPWTEFIELVQRYGGKASLAGETLTLQGPVSFPKEVEIDCARTTQFASGIELAFFKTTKVIPLNMTSSQSYWRMTEELVSTLMDKDSFNTPLDWSSASYPMAFAALNQSVFFPGLHHDPYQSDAKFLDILKELGAVNLDTEGIWIHKIKNKKEISLDVSDCLDLVPALAFLLAHIEGSHELKGLNNLIFKESDRLAEVKKLLSLFERKTEESDGSLIIHGHNTKILSSIHLVLPDDHRMIMAASLFLRHHHGGEVDPHEAVEKSYPQFFNLFS